MNKRECVPLKQTLETYHAKGFANLYQLLGHLRVDFRYALEGPRLIVGTLG